MTASRTLPALQSITCRPPKRVDRLCDERVDLVGCETSVWTAIASPPSALISSATALALSPSMSQTTTFAPSRA